MATKGLQIDLDKLNDLFFDDEIEWRAGMTGMSGDTPWVTVLAYLDARAVMNRLDEACGKFNWHDSYSTGAAGGVMCHLSIKGEDGVWITKCDAAENTSIEPIKGGVSDAFKRAFVKWSKGARQLYRIKNKYGVICNKHDNGAKYFKGGDGRRYHFLPPVIKEEGIVHYRGDAPEPESEQSIDNIIDKANDQAETPTDKPKSTNTGDKLSAKQVGLIYVKFKTNYGITDDGIIHQIASEFLHDEYTSLNDIPWRTGKILIDTLMRAFTPEHDNYIMLEAAVEKMTGTESNIPDKPEITKEQESLFDSSLNNHDDEDVPF